MIWSRETDMQHGYYRPAGMARFAALLDELSSERDVVKASMFGMPGIKRRGGKAFCGLYGDDMIFKLQGEDHARARPSQRLVRRCRDEIGMGHRAGVLLGGDVDVMGGKTGFITKAGYCLATLLRLPPEREACPNNIPPDDRIP
jgi:hypothetical protein